MCKMFMRNYKLCLLERNIFLEEGKIENKKENKHQIIELRVLSIENKTKELEKLSIRLHKNYYE